MARPDGSLINWDEVRAESDGWLDEWRELVALRARVAGLEADAARYRWLRVNGGWQCTPEAADKLIDDAMHEDRDAGNKGGSRNGE